MTGGVVVAVTRVRLRSAVYLPLFVWQTTLLKREALHSFGNLRSDLRRTGGLSFWTLTAWSSAEALIAFTGAGRHARVRPRANDWFDEASFARFASDGTSDLWPRATAWLEREGRLVPVRHPSVAQASGDPIGSDRVRFATLSRSASSL